MYGLETSHGKWAGIMWKTDGRGWSTGLIRVSKMQQLVPRLFCFDSPLLVAARLPQKTVNYGIRRPGCCMQPGQSTNTRSRIGQCTREGNQFTIYRGTRFKSAFYGVTCDGHVEVDKGVRSTLNWGENGTRMKGGHGSSRVMHRKKKNDAKRDEEAAPQTYGINFQQRSDDAHWILAWFISPFRDMGVVAVSRLIMFVMRWPCR